MKPIRFRGLFKGLFFVTRAHYLVPSYVLNFFGHIAELSRFVHKHKNSEFNDFYTFEFDYAKREKMFDYLIETYQLDSEIDYLEFGVSTGGSFRWWVDKIKNPGARFYGFDTFTGLPEDWGPFKAGDMANGNEPPVIEDDSRHTFYQGLFQQTLIPFLKKYDGADRPKVIHMDADLYSATWYVLALITPYLKKGDIIMFDEFNVPMHEWKAFSEWTSSFYINYRVIGGVNNFYQTSVMIE
ncbi:hypothetical protein CEQ90_00115 [Lewinellaceae bacterium SD302]|nr:hypothetical protein CEQ90_00115 [Lewinellaceae bacterium SD302]